MIGASSRGASFGGLANYLVTVQNPEKPERVSLMQTRNLPTDKAKVAAAIMRATAAQSKRVQKPVYHLILSWHEDDNLTPEEMAEAMDRTLADLGLSEHEALYVAHGDTDTPHIHAAVNRVREHDDGKARAWEGRADRYTIRDSCMAQEVEKDWRKTEKKARTRGYDIKEQEIAAREQRDPGRHMGKDDAKQMREDLRHTMETSVDWADLEGRLARRGLELRVAGNGIRIFSGGKYVKLSEVMPPKMNAKKLHNKLGDFKKYQQRKAEKSVSREAPKGLKRKRQRDRDR